MLNEEAINQKEVSPWLRISKYTLAVLILCSAHVAAPSKTKSKSETCFHKCSVALFLKGITPHRFSNMNGQNPINRTDDVFP